MVINNSCQGLISQWQEQDMLLYRLRLAVAVLTRIAFFLNGSKFVTIAPYFPQVQERAFDNATCGFISGDTGTHSPATFAS